MRESRRREAARLYSEMYDEGYSPSRGLGPAFAVMCAFFIATVGMIVLTIATLLTGRVFWIEHLVG